MHTIRRANLEDAAIIAKQRCAMFQDNDLPCAGSWDELEAASLEWLGRHLADGSYAGWLIEEDGRTVGGAGVWFMEWPPHFLHLEPVRGYLLNFYVHTSARGRGLARELVNLAVDECKQRGVKLAVLHASKMGRPIYATMEFQDGNEMTRQL